MTPVANTQRGGDLCVYKTVDPVTGEDLPDGTEGELASTGPTHMLGYWDKPAETAQALRDGWVYSGDLGVVQPDGYLRVTGRSKELYKSGGELVMPLKSCKNESVSCHLASTCAEYSGGTTLTFGN